MRAEGIEPSRPSRGSGFSYHLRLSPPCRSRRRQVCGLDYTFAMLKKLLSQFRRCPSSLYTFPPESSSGRAWLGIAISQGSPNLSSSASPVSRRALKFCSSPVRLPIPPRPHAHPYYMASAFGPTFFWAAAVGGGSGPRLNQLRQSASLVQWLASHIIWQK